MSRNVSPFTPVLVALCGLTVPAAAFVIESPTPEANYVYASGFPAARQRNTSPDFMAAPYDLSGTGWETVSGTTNRLRNISMISPVHYLFAAHFTGFLVGTEVAFVSPSNEVSRRTIANFQKHNTGGGSTNSYYTSNDILTGSMTVAFSAAEQIGIYRFLEVANWDYRGFRTLIYGSNAGGPGPMVGTTLSMRTSPPSIPWGEAGSYPGKALYQQTGDSGSPGLFLTTGAGGEAQITIAGTAWFATSLGAALPFLPTAESGRLDTNVVTPLGIGVWDPVTPINNTLRDLGYAMKWTIYDNPSDPDRTGALWTAEAGDGSLANPGNWQTDAVPTNRAVVFDGTLTGSSQREVSVDQATLLRGMLFRPASSADGFVISGASTLTLGYAGIRNESAAQQTINNPIILASSQNWEAAAGPLVFNGSINTFSSWGNLLVIDGDHDTVINGRVTGSGQLAKDGGGTLTLTASNTYSGNTTIHRGELRLGPSATLATNTSIVFLAPNPAVFNLNGRGVTLRDVRSSHGGSGLVRLGGGTLAISNTNVSTNIFAGVIAESGNVIKRGPGTWTVGGELQHVGATTIEAGSLRLVSTSPNPVGFTGANSISISNAAALDATNLSGGFAVLPGQVLTGSGTLRGDLTLIAGTLDPGSAFLTGTFSVDGSFTAQAPSLLAFRIAATNSHDALLAASGVVDGGIRVDLAPSYVPAAGDSFRLITANSLAGSPSFDLPALPADLVWTTNSFSSTGVLGIASATSSAYENWLAHYPSLTDPSPSADPDLDGMSNALEYALGGDPAVPNGGLVEAGVSASEIVFTFLARRVAGEASYLVRTTSDLASGVWTDAPGLTESIRDSSDQSGVPLPAEYVRREFSVPIAAHGFYRLQVTIP